MKRLCAPRADIFLCSHSLTLSHLAAALCVSFLASLGCSEEPTANAASDASGSSDAVADAQSADASSVDAAQDAGPEDTGPSTPPCKPYKKPSDPDWGCPAGEKCVWGASGSECVPAGTKPAGADCENPDECAVGICISNTAGSARCSPFCLSSVQCTVGPCNKLDGGKGSVCDMGGDPVPQCNPLSQSCDAGFGCYYTPDGFVCKSAGKEAAGSKCPADNDCVKGSACVGKSGSSAGICRKICSKSGNGPKCDVGVSCSTLGGDVGYCDG